MITCSAGPRTRQLPVWQESLPQWEHSAIPTAQSLQQRRMFFCTQHDFDSLRCHRTATPSEQNPHFCLVKTRETQVSFHLWKHDFNIPLGTREQILWLMPVEQLISSDAWRRDRTIFRSSRKTSAEVLLMRTDLSFWFSHVSPVSQKSPGETTGMGGKKKTVSQNWKIWCHYLCLEFILRNLWKEARTITISLFCWSIQSVLWNFSGSRSALRFRLRHGHKTSGGAGWYGCCASDGASSGGCAAGCSFWGNCGGGGGCGWTVWVTWYVFLIGTRDF